MAMSEFRSKAGRWQFVYMRIRPTNLVKTAQNDLRGSCGHQDAMQCNCHSTLCPRKRDQKRFFV